MNTHTGAKEEVEFWKGFVKTERFLKGWASNTKTPELLNEVADFIIEHSPCKVMDVGSGVASLLNGTVAKECLTAVDPLGNEYSEIFDYDAYNIAPPLAFAAENLPFENAFDIVHMSNAIDHSIDPVVAYNKLLMAVKPGGYLILQGFFNEGTFEKWFGMHQWNIYVKDNTLFVEDKNGNVATMAKDPTKVTIYNRNGKQWYVWIAQK